MCKREERKSTVKLKMINLLSILITKLQKMESLIEINYQILLFYIIKRHFLSCIQVQTHQGWYKLNVQAKWGNLLLAFYPYRP